MRLLNAFRRMMSSGLKSKTTPCHTTECKASINGREQSLLLS